MAGKEKIYQEKIQPRLQDITWWCREGATNKDLAENLEISERQFYRALAVHQELKDAIREGKEEADHKVEDSLFTRARGKAYEETVVEHEKGQRGGKEYEFTKTKTVQREIPPDTHAAVFWLKNRQPKKWRDKFEAELKTKVVIIYDLKQPKKAKQESANDPGSGP